MIDYTRQVLDNGLKVIVNTDKTTPLAAMHLLYDAGSKDEDPGHTGVAHLLEHLMFGGSENIPDYDTPLQNAAGENNASTNNDYTIYYLTVPSGNIETGFWLESDRMAGLILTNDKLDVQKSVVMEEFKQRYLNQPYGDYMHLLRDHVYTCHPYKWPTIGKELSHISGIDLQLVSDFYSSYYAPGNAILSISGNIETAQAVKLADKWFGGIPPGNVRKRNIPPEPVQTEGRSISVERPVPSDFLSKAWHICRRADRDFYTLDVLTDILSGGDSGRLYESLVREKQLFSDINAYITGEIEPGMLIINGKLLDNVNILDAEQEVMKIVGSIINGEIDDYEMEKVRNRFEAVSIISNTSIIHRSNALALFELLGDPGMVNSEVERYRNVTPEMVSEAAYTYFNPERCTTLYYRSDKHSIRYDGGRQF